MVILNNELNTNNTVFILLGYLTKNTLKRLLTFILVDNFNKDDIKHYKDIHTYFVNSKYIDEKYLII